MLSGSPLFLGPMLKEYRRDHNLKQSDVATLLSIDVRTLRSYENGEHVLEQMTELRRIVQLLGFEPERVGLSFISLPRSFDEITSVIEYAWSLIAQARNVEARATIEQLIRQMMISMMPEDREGLSALARAHYVAGYVISLNTHTKDVGRAIQHFQEMEAIARVMENDSLLNIALTYHGDILRRQGDLRGAILYLEAARDTTPGADTASRGNAIQLLARAYVQHGDLTDFERSMSMAEELAHSIDAPSSVTHGLYCPGTVYEEYSRGYGALGQLDKSLHYLTLAEQELLPAERWQTLLTTTRAVNLVRGGEFHAGVQAAMTAAMLCRKVGNVRCLERIYAIQQHLDKLSRFAGQESGVLRDILYDPIGQWNMQS